MNSQSSTLNPVSLLFIFALAQTLEHGEARLLGVGNGERLELDRRIKGRDELAHRAAADGTDFQRRRMEGAPQGELPAADLAFAFTQLVFVKGHGTNFDFRSSNKGLKKSIGFTFGFKSL